MHFHTAAAAAHPVELPEGLTLTSLVRLLGLRWDGLPEVSAGHAGDDGVRAGPGCSAVDCCRWGRRGRLHASLGRGVLQPQQQQKQKYKEVNNQQS